MSYAEPSLKVEPRYPELDSLRGLAAFAVLTYHCLCMWWSPTVFDMGWRSLLYPLVAGHEAVLLFFLLSGLVLSFPLLAGSKVPYERYALRRVLRIYGPYLGALILSVVGAYLWHSRTAFGRWSGKTWSEPVHASLLLQHILFIGAYRSNEYNLAFWSLIIELRISLLFPFLFVWVQRLRPMIAIILSVLSSLTAEWLVITDHSHADLWGTFEYAGMFVCGIVMAQHLDQISRWFRGIGRRGGIVLLLGSFALYHEGHRLQDVRGLWRLHDWASVLGAVGLIVVSLNFRPVSIALRQRIPRYLGRISYSLYLIHGTVLFTLAVWWDSKLPRIAFLFLYITVVLVCSTLFCNLVEQPFIRKSREIGRPQRETVIS